MSSNVPQLRFPEFEEEWESKKLGDIGEFKNGINKSSSDFGYGIPFVNLMDVFGKSILRKEEFGLVNATNNEKKQYNLIDGDVLFIRSSVKRSGVGETIVVSETLQETVYSGFLIRFRDINVISKEFKKYCFWTTQFRNQLISMSTTSANTNINQESLKILTISIPSLPEQQRIATFLTSVDEKLQALKKKKELLEQYKKGAMQKLFSQELRFKQDDGSAFPDWESRKLGELGEIITGKTPKTSHKELWGGNIDFITPTDINDSKKYQTNVARTVKKTEKLKVLPVNSIVYTCIASIGKIALTSKPAVTNQQINSVIVKEDFDSNCLYYALLNMTPKIKSTQANTTLPIINKTEFSKFRISLPSLPEQEKIADFLSSIDESIENVGKQIEESQEWKKGLLQKMFV